MTMSATVRTPESERTGRPSAASTLQASLHSVSDILRLETQLARSHPTLQWAEPSV
ncbi:hypothetical protein ABZX77_09195 [Streptomyces sp. NPDC004237]|uniref:hypothetical protein n=1 Tax=Streptomyces sp. NPDC004237 TaxID=3154455 RepID=UPI0033BBB809